MVVVMAKVPRAGHAKTRLIPALGADGAARLASAMAADVFDLLLAAGLDARVAVEGPLDHPWVRALPFPWEPQAPGDLGERLAFALRDGGTAIGTDCPHLQLPARDAPGLHLVPTLDGGYAMIGVPSPVPALWPGLPWSSPDTLRATYARARRLGLPVTLHPVTFDVDEPADLPLLRAHLAARPSLAPATRACLDTLDAPPLR